MAEYLRRNVEKAQLARCVQNILMFPSVHTFTHIANKNQLPNFPIQQSDIIAAEQIFGPNLGALKGKTTKQRSTPVSGQIDNIPPSIKECFRSGVILAIDIMFANEIPFLLTISEELLFGTVANLKNRKMTTIATALRQQADTQHISPTWDEGFLNQG